MRYADFQKFSFGVKVAETRVERKTWGRKRVGLVSGEKQTSSEDVSIT